MNYQDDRDEADEDVLAYEDTRIGLRLVRAAIDDVATRDDLVSLGVLQTDFFLKGLSVAWGAILAQPHGSRVTVELLRSALERDMGPGAGAEAIRAIMSERPVETDNLMGVVDHMRRRVAMRRLGALGRKLARAPVEGDPISLARELEDEASRVSMQATSISGVGGRQLGHIANDLLEGKRQLFDHVPTGMRAIDKALGGGAVCGRTSLMIVRVGGGKSTFGRLKSLSAARANVPALIVSTEEEPPEIARSFVEQIAGRRMPKAGEEIGREAAAALAGAAGLISELPLHVEYRPSITATELVAIARVYVQRFGVKYVVVDYVQDLELPPGRDDLHEKHSKNSRILNAGARRTGVAMDLLAQVAADTKGEPKVDDVAGGKRYAKDAVAVVTADRDREAKNDRKRNTSRVALKKNRIYGTLDSMFMRYDPTSGRMFECAADGEDVDAPVQMARTERADMWEDADA
jgi:replicative DNA helicase